LEKTKIVVMEGWEGYGGLLIGAIVQQDPAKNNRHIREDFARQTANPFTV
jgi:hypothetical protein